jgi:hypothetical protein
MTSLTQPEDVFALHGLWWLPADAETRIGGTLDFHSDGGGTLRLHGGLRGEAALARSEIVFGETDRGPVTLTDALQTGHHARGEQRNVTSETWRCHTLVIGRHWAEGDLTPIAFARLETILLPWWTAKSRPHHEWDTDGRGEILRVDLPSSLRADIAGGKLSIDWLSASRLGQMEAQIDAAPGLAYEPSQPVTVANLWRELITPSLFLTTFATGQADGIARLTVQEDLAEVSSPADVRFSRWWGTPLSSSPDWWSFLLPFEDFEARFDELCRLWFDLHASIRTSLQEFFSVSFTPSMYLEDSFNRTVRSLELFHRARMGGQLMSDVDYRDLLDRVKGAVTRDQWQVASMRLNYGNEPTQKQRLEELVMRAGSPIAPLIESFRKFPRRVVDRRNQLTHGSEGKPPSMTDLHMAWASDCLAVVFHAVLLRELGFDEDATEALVTRSRAWKQASWPGNPWIGEALGNLP